MSVAPQEIARELLEALAARRQIAPLTDRDPAFDLAAAYRVTAAIRSLREARGERVLGRKIGFTNTTIWDEYGVHAPIWGFVYDTTLFRLADLSGPFGLSRLVEPRIEPEIVLSLGRAPAPGMDEAALMGCVAGIAHGFEIVQSLFAGWRFRAPDTVAAFGLHGALLVGPGMEVTPATAADWLQKLAAFDIALMRGGVVEDRGKASDVLGGGPLAALRHLVGVLAKDPGQPPLAAGEIVSTGTLTRALPIAPGESWSTELAGLPLAGIEARFS
jgi:2-oxo-3-hexenedioate decarboxylase